MRAPCLALVVSLLIIPAAAALGDEGLIETGTVVIRPRLQLDFYYHQLTDNWRLTKSGLDNYYAYSSSAPTTTDGEFFTGQTLFLDLSLRPTNALTADFGFELIHEYADRYWRPHNREHDFALTGRKFGWNTANINYTRDWANLRYARGVGRLDWTREGDMFGAFSEMYIPQLFEVISKGKLGRLQLVYGMDGSWDYINTHPKIGIFGNNAYLNYNFKLGGGSYHLLCKDELSMYDPDNERVTLYELTGSYEVGDNPLEVGLLYRPFRVGWDYEYVEDAPAGAGDFGSSYLRRTGTTGTQDAFGGGIKFSYKKFSFLDDASLKYTYQGLVAGNKQSVGVEMTRRVSHPLTTVVGGTYRRPLKGPMPLVYEGTPAVPGPALFEPRGPESPFWVQWDNREATVISLMATFDPTPSSNFYLYQPNIPEEWNLSPDENARFACASRYTLTRYHTGTDRQIYWSSSGAPLWEGYGSGGAWATDGFIGALTLLGVNNFTNPRMRLVSTLELGDSLATASAAYSTSRVSLKPITGYLIAGVSLQKKPYELGLKYYQDYWGPEYWHRTFGESCDRIYQARVSRQFSKNITAGLEYVGVRERDQVYVAPELGDYDEYRCFFTLTFGPIIGYFASAWEAAPDEPEADMTPPFVALSVTPRSFVIGSGTSSACAIEPRAADVNSVSQWEVAITGPSGRVVKTFEGKGQPPDTIMWDGSDDVYAMPVRTGLYLAVLTARDPAGNMASSRPAEIEVTGPSQEIIKVVEKQVVVTEIDRGLKVSLTSNVLFDIGKSTLKPAARAALKEVSRIVAAYPENKIMIEGHTDSAGEAAKNQILSEARARSVADHLIAGGVARERVKTVGFGESKPVVSNTTVKGREANRRVEVIILKKEGQ